MQLFFLEADRPLTKSFAIDENGELSKSSYPIVKNFVSHEEHVADIDEFHDAVTRHAAEGHCLLKGRLSKQLKNEPRAGTTNSLDLTQWVCFDFDNVEGIVSAEAAIQLVLPEFHNISYIIQQSASAGISGEAGLRAHLFFMLDEPVSPDVLKLWITEKNLTNPILSKNLALSANALTLKFTLDRTVVQNDKLIYIAPPTLDGLEDPLDKRIELVKKEKNTAPVPKGAWTPANAQVLTDDHINRMREEQGLPKRSPKISIDSGIEILTNPGVGMVTGEKQDRQWMRINVAGESPSWAYYYDMLNPEILYNFKGQPAVYLKDFLPEYYTQAQQRASRLREQKQKETGIRPFVFRDFDTDTFYNARYDNDKKELLDCSPTRGDGRRLKFFFGQYGMQPPEIIEDWTYRFDPQDTRIVSFEDRFLNQWRPTDLILNPPHSSEIPPTIKMVLMNALGDDEECFDHFINWLACIYQTRSKMLTAWIIHGIEGTGKGTILTKILEPIFGKEHTLETLVSHFDDKFNKHLSTALICAIDETKADSSKNLDAFMSKLKNAITEPRIAIRGMRQDLYMAQSFVNFLLFSNSLAVVQIGGTDRRFNVSPRQERTLLEAMARFYGRQPTQDDFDRIKDEDTPLFAGYLKQYKADFNTANRALENESKIKMRLASMDALEQIINSIRDGDLAYFIDCLEESNVTATSNHAYQEYEEVLKTWAENVGQRTVVSSRELQKVYSFLLKPGKEMGVQTFNRMMAHKSVDMKSFHWDDKVGRSTRGMPAEWRLDDISLAAFKKKHTKPVVTTDMLNKNTAPKGAS